MDIFNLIGMTTCIMGVIGFLIWTSISNSEANDHADAIERLLTSIEKLTDAQAELVKRVNDLDSDSNDLWDELQNKQDRKWK